MPVLQHLSVLTLRHVAEGACESLGLMMGERSVETVVGFLTRHFTDHSQSLSRAMQRANDSSWKALEIALAGESLWLWLDKADNKAFRQQVRDFLDAAPLAGLVSYGPDFRKLCLRELRQARKDGMLTGSLEPTSLAQQVGEFTRFSDPQKLLEAEWEAVRRMAEECRQANYRNLSHLMELRDAGADSLPLLVVAVRFFFRREIETDQQLFQGLSWAKFELLQSTQEQAFRSLFEVMTSHHDQVEVMLGSVQTVVLETHEAVKDIQNEVVNLAQRFDLLHRELRPRDSLSISSDAERQLVKQLVKRYRSLSEEQRSQFPSLLNAIGKLEVAAGSFAEAQQDFQEAAVLAEDENEKAEAQYNRYGAALERGDFAAALEALQQAAELQAEKYAPFPLKKFEPERILGAGGFGVAFLCRNRLTGSRVVVKTLRGETLDRDLTEVFREARLLEDLDHPAIIRLRDCDFADEAMTRPYLVMDYFDGKTLEAYVEENGALSPEELVSLIRPVAEALKVAHERGILHRDVKPGNLLVRKEADGWNVKLIDFGLALKQDVMNTTAVSTAGGQRTITGYSIAGTMDYAAPEQMGKLPGVSVGPYTDVYGLAKTCCYALFKTVQPLRKHWREIPEALADFIEQCLSEAPKERLADFSKVLQAVDELSGVASDSQTPAQVEVVAPSSPAPDSEAESITTPQSSLPASPKREWWRSAPKEGSASGQVIQRLTGHTDAVLALAFSHGSKNLLSGSADNTVRLWSAQSGAELLQLFGHTDQVWDVYFLPEERLALSSGKDKSVRIWDLKRGEETRCFAARTNRSIAVSPDGQYAVTGNLTDGMIRVWELKNGRELRRLKGHMSWVLALAFSHNGRHVLSGSADGTVRYWDVHSGRELRRMQGHGDQVCSVAFASSYRRALSASADKTVRLWDLNTGKEIKRYDYRDQVWKVAVSSDDHLALSGTDSRAVRLWELRTNREFAMEHGHTGKVLSVAFSPDCQLAATGGADKTICVWRLPA